MDRMVYLAMNGAKQIMASQAALANNLANANTPGFKADLVQARSMPVFGEGYSSRVYALAERPGADMRGGTINHTGRDLDVAVTGDGWIAVQAPDGSEAYTRAGDFHVSEGGLLLTGGGFPVNGDGGPIAIPPAAKVSISEDGTISILGQGQDDGDLVELDRIKLVRAPPDLLAKGEFGLFQATDGLPLEVDGAVRVVPAALEASNVNSISALVDMIGLARQFESQIRLMNAAQENDERAASMLSLNR